MYRRHKTDLLDNNVYLFIKYVFLYSYSTQYINSLFLFAGSLGCLIELLRVMKFPVTQAVHLESIIVQSVE